MGEKNIYLLFTRSHTLMSRIVFFFTNDDYTHVAISTDDRLRDFYSFGRRVPQTLLPAGFTKEAADSSLYREGENIPCRLLMIPAEEYDVKKLEKMLSFYYEYRFYYKYSILGVIFCKIGIPYTRAQHRFCSQFVSELLQELGILCRDRAPSLTRPSHLLEELSAYTVFEGSMKDFQSRKIGFC